MSTASAGAVVAVESLSRRFGATLAVDAVSFSVESGAIFGLVGPDGAGKTTIMRMLAGVMKPDGGRIVVDGVDAVADPESVKTHLSYMPQRFGLYEDLTVDENIRFYADLFEIPQRLREQRTLPLLEASNQMCIRDRCRTPRSFLAAQGTRCPDLEEGSRRIFQGPDQGAGCGVARPFR